VSDPFGDDDIDFDLEPMLAGSYNNAIASLRDDHTPYVSDLPDRMAPNPLVQARREPTRARPKPAPKGLEIADLGQTVLEQGREIADEIADTLAVPVRMLSGAVNGSTNAAAESVSHAAAFAEDDDDQRKAAPTLASTPLSELSTYRVLSSGPVGIELDMTPSGLAVVSVAPGSAADEAQVPPDVLLVRLNGTDVTPASGHDVNSVCGLISKSGRPLVLAVAAPSAMQI
jgi:C-terminal processing protease CtpA/Prc